MIKFEEIYRVKIVMAARDAFDSIDFDAIEDLETAINKKIDELWTDPNPFGEKTEAIEIRNIKIYYPPNCQMIFAVITIRAKREVLTPTGMNVDKKK